MIKRNWKTYAFWVLLAEAVGALSGWITREGTRYFAENVAQPPLSPPALLFPIVWGILYFLMGVGAARVSLSPDSPARSRGLNLFMIQLAVNFLWSPVFFNLRAYGIAFFWLLFLFALTVAMTIAFREVDPLAAKLQIPYLIWLGFAAYLNLGVWYLNR